MEVESLDTYLFSLGPSKNGAHNLESIPSMLCPYGKPMELTSSQIHSCLWPSETKLCPKFHPLHYRFLLPCLFLMTNIHHGRLHQRNRLSPKTLFRPKGKQSSNASTAVRRQRPADQAGEGSNYKETTAERRYKHHA